MSVREVGLVAIGVVAGAAAMIGLGAYLAAEAARVDYVTRMLALRFRARTEGQG